MPDEPVRILLLVAHPDDAEAHAGGLMAIARGLGHVVKWVSLTNGDAGHHQLPREELARVRKKEAQAAAAVIGAESDVWDNHDGELMPTLELRSQVIREIRTFQPDLVLTHRTVDYHPDHRAVGQVVQDACYMVTVPLAVPEVPALRRDPVVAYMSDLFTRPVPLRCDIVVDVTEQLDTIVEMLHCHRSQMYEWLPFNQRIEETVPKTDRERKSWLADGFLTHRARKVADRCREELILTYGEERGSVVQMAEAFEISEYAAPLDAAVHKRLFGFLPQ